MAYDEKLRQIDELRTKIQGYGALPADVLKKVNYKFRLEWNYTSNSMEGNSLTRSETRSVMIGNITVHGKPIKDVLEMKGHDEVITFILRLGAGELQLSETRIRDIHKGIMHEEDPEKAALIGKWKTQDNYLFNYKNERIDFTPHADVPDAMHRLTDWLSAQREKIARGDADALHPALLAFRFHLDYVSIHPFYDGNGRTARILTNLLFIAYGYPPVWIREDERNAYYQYLADVQGYGGSPDVFYGFMAELLLRSQQLLLDAIEGREIEEPNDWEKRLAMVDKQLEVLNRDNLHIVFGVKTFIQCYNDWLRQLTDELIRVARRFNQYYVSNHHRIYLQTAAVGQDVGDQATGDVLDAFLGQISERASHFTTEDEFKFWFSYGPFKKPVAVDKLHGCQYGFEIKFEAFNYTVMVSKLREERDEDGTPQQRFVFAQRLLHQPLTASEIRDIAAHYGKLLVDHIEFYFLNGTES